MDKIILTPILGILPSLFWLYFFLKKDPKPEPRILILLTFLIGALFVFPVLLIEKSLHKIFVFLNIAQTSFLVLLIIAFTEEIFKFVAAYISTKDNSEFNEATDVMIYPIIAALGFATLENLAIVHSLFYTQPLFLQGIFMITLLRFMGAIFLHALCGGIIGFFWAKGIIFKKVFPFISLGIVLSTALHFSFNYLILRSELEMFLSFIILFISSFFVLIFFKHLKKYDNQNKNLIN